MDSSSMEATSLVFFANVVDAGSFAAASRSMELDRSNVSRKVRELEEELGSQLLRRSTRSMELTEAGAFFYERCCLVRAEVEYTYRSMLDLSGSVRGMVTMSCPPMLARGIVAPLLVEFCKQYPLVDLKLLLTHNVGDLITQKVDLSLQMTNSPDPSTVARELMKVNWVICSSERYLADRPLPKHPSELTDLAWVDQVNRSHLELKAEGQEIERARIKTRLQCIDLAFVERALTEGFGVGVLPDYIANPSLRDGKLTQVLSGYTVHGMPWSTLYAVTLPTRYMPSKLKALVDFITRPFQRQEGAQDPASAPNH